MTLLLLFPTASRGGCPGIRLVYITGTAVGKERPCPPGTYSPSFSLADSGECISCMPGYYCPQGSAEQKNCPRGSFCPKRTESPNHHPCPGGTYNPSEMSIVSR